MKEEEVRSKFGSIHGVEKKQKSKSRKEYKKKQKQIKAMYPPSGKALMYVLCTKGLSSVSALADLLINGKNFISIGHKKFIYLVLDPGVHVLEAKIKRSNPKLQLILEPNKAYYINIKITKASAPTVALVSPYYAEFKVLDEIKGEKLLSKKVLLEHFLKFPIPALQENQETNEEQESRKNEIKEMKF
ncbi:MAG: hypothetical protein ACFFAS_17995 [Promethearchaeota archaeon]